MQDNGDLARYSDLGLLGSDPFHQPRAPGLQCRPALGPVQEHAGDLEQVCPQQTVTPFRDAAVDVLRTGLLSPRRKAQIGTDRIC